ncbi:hypothetical protein E4T81_06175 [Barnesiella sp. WM24]|uniref:hypothetical protein n=1 Tax=Barnesiella sp. WM24 TaxID=2558278 RepID=UPI0010718B68|nr:hypothetical protein [Barnesiella sp. WM24]TFU93545.1 hypothetical protein E4T81_06175 [Barnesiella sp. WM24]
MNKYISVNKEGIKALQRTFKVNGKEICERCVKNALAYRTNNELARKIRFAAIKHHGGCTYYNIPEGEFFFDSDSCWHAVYPNGAEVYLDKQTGEGVVYGPKGNVVAKYANVLLSQIDDIKEQAAALR